MMLAIDPPQKGVESDATVDKYLAEKKKVMDGLKERAQLLS